MNRLLGTRAEMSSRPAHERHIRLADGTRVRLIVFNPQYADFLQEWSSHSHLRTDREVRNHACIARCGAPNGHTPALCKSFYARSRIDFWLQQVLLTRADRAARGNFILQHSGFFAPEVLATSATYRFGLVCTSALYTTELVDFETLRVRLSRHDSVEARKALLEQMVEVLVALHREGIFHGDLQSDNVLLCQENTFAFVDNERTTRLRYLPLIYRLRNLRQLLSVRAGVSVEEKRFVVERYADRASLSPSQREFLLRNCLSARSRRRMFGIHVPDNLSLRKGFWRLFFPFLVSQR